MNKFFATVAFVLAGVGLLKAQNSHLKFLKDTTISEIKFFKGEIVAFKKNENRIDLNIGKEVIKVSNVAWSSFDTTQKPNDTYLSNAKSFVTSKDEEFIFVDAAHISPGDTVILKSASGETVLQLTDKRNAQVKKSDCGEIFTLIITNSPSIYYSIDELQQYSPPVADGDGDGIIDEQDGCPLEAGEQANQGCPESGRAWWHYVLLLGIIAGIGFAGWLIYNKLKNKNLEEKQAAYNGNSLSEFAHNNGLTLRKLIKLNKDKIDKNYERSPEDHRIQVQNSLKSKSLVVGYQRKSKSEDGTVLRFGKSGPGDMKREPDTSLMSEANETPGIPSYGEHQEKIIKKLEQIEKNLVLEIKNAGLKNNINTDELNRLSNEIHKLKEENKKIKVENEGNQTVITQLGKDKKKLEGSIDNQTAEKNKLYVKIVEADNLIEYCDSVLGYFKLCKAVLSEAYDCFNRISLQHSPHASTVSLLLTKFSELVNSLPVGNWIQIAKDIKDTGITSSALIKNSFRQLETAEDRKKQFQRLFFSEVLVKYSSSILILAEEFRNLSHFQLSSQITNEVQHRFEKHVLELVNKVRSTGLENKYVPLFKHFEDFIEHVESVDRERSLAYQNVGGLKNEAIVEVVSYGVKTAYDDTKTMIILA